MARVGGEAGPRAHVGFLEAGYRSSELNQTVLVLGATSAIAIAYCRRLAAEGAAFVLVGRQSGRLKTIADPSGEYAGSPWSNRLDVSNWRPLPSAAIV